MRCAFIQPTFLAHRPAPNRLIHHHRSPQFRRHIHPHPPHPLRLLAHPTACAHPQPSPLSPRTPTPAPAPASSKSPISLSSIFPPAVFLSTTVALLYPPSFLWFKTSYIIPFLSLIMLGMGLTTPPSSLLSLFRTPLPILLGILSQYTLMPTLATILSRLLHLPPALAAGVILVGVCPGGVASNVMCLLGNADVPFSVVLTLSSTLLAVFMIPLLMRLLAGALVPVNATALLLSTSQIVLLPLLAGLLLRRLAPRLINAVSNSLPALSATAVLLICAGVVARNAAAVRAIGMPVLACMVLMHALGGVLGYTVAGLAGLRRERKRTMAIEVMMQNSTLAVSLAIAHLPHPLTAVPGVISAVVHAIMGSLVASSWRFWDSRGEKRHDDVRG